MITSQQISLLSELRQTPIPKATLIEMEATLQHRIHSMILNAFNKSGLSQKELATRLGWDESRISRLLRSASNLTLATVSALLAATGVDLDDHTYTSFDVLEERLRTPNHLPSRERHELLAEVIELLVGAKMIRDELVSSRNESRLPSIPLERSGRNKVLEFPRPPASNAKVASPFYRGASQGGENQNISFDGEQRYAG